MTHNEERQLFNMVAEIYHHLGLDGARPLSFSSIQNQAEKDVLKWNQKKLKKGHECETPTR
jgi:hypothetical protein